VSEWVERLEDLSSCQRWVFPVNHLHWYWQPNNNNQETEHTNNTKWHNAKSGPRHTHKKRRLKDRTHRAWFSCLVVVWHPARKRSGYILTTPECTWGYTIMEQSQHDDPPRAVTHQWKMEFNPRNPFRHDGGLLCQTLKFYIRWYECPYVGPKLAFSHSPASLIL